MTILYILATISGVFLAFGALPQAIKIYREKSAHDVSAVTYVITIVGGSIWFFYGIEIKNFPVILANGIGIVNAAIVLIGWYLYGHDKSI